MGYKNISHKTRKVQLQGKPKTRKSVDPCTGERKEEEKTEERARKAREQRKQV
jgi:hypothetical protein